MSTTALRLLLGALVAVHSFAPSVHAEPAPVPDSPLTAPPARRTANHHDIAKRQATNSPLPLTEYKFPFSQIPYQVNPFPVGRGPQSGYNQCNSTTEGDNSQCQTAIVNNLSDFCLWGGPKNGTTIGDSEAAVVAYCSQKGHGARVIGPGFITGAQFMKTSAYIQVVGHINLAGVGLDPNDTGGELDPHGADLLGNPLGGLVYTNNLPSFKDQSQLQQAVQWNNFIGSGTFCFKLCDPTVTSPNYCENRLDLLGCSYNMPASYKDGEFTSCEGELQDVVGVYTSNGQTLTYSQPSVLNGPPPYTPRIPASSNCQTFSSAQLFGGASSSGSSGSGSSTKSGSGSGSSGTSGSSGNGAASLTPATGLLPMIATTCAFALVGAAVVLM